MEGTVKMEKFLLNLNILEYNYLVLSDRGFGFTTLTHQKKGESAEFKVVENIEVLSEYALIKSLLNGGMGYIGVLRNDKEWVIVNLLEVRHHVWKSGVHLNPVLYGEGNEMCISTISFKDGGDVLKFPHNSDPELFDRETCLANKVYNSGLFLLDGEFFKYKDTTIIVENRSDKTVKVLVDGVFKDFPEGSIVQSCVMRGKLQEDVELRDLPVYVTINDSVNNRTIYYNWMTTSLVQDEDNLYLLANNKDLLNVGKCVEFNGRELGSFLQGYVDETDLKIPILETSSNFNILEGMTV